MTLAERAYREFLQAVGARETVEWQDAPTFVRDGWDRVVKIILDRAAREPKGDDAETVAKAIRDLAKADERQTMSANGDHSELPKAYD